MRTITPLLALLLAPIVRGSFDDWTTVVDTADPDTAQALAHLTAHQNPSSCDADTRYLVSEYWNGGLGAIFHVISNHLSHALSLNRVLIWHPNMKWMWTHKSFCPKDLMSPDCYLQPYSHCQSNVTHVSSRERCCGRRSAMSKAQYMHIRGPRFNDTIPVIRSNGRTLTGDLGWWRAISTKYLLRPNSRLLTACREFLADHLVYLEPMGAPVLAYPSRSPPKQAIGMHIRHGDKKIESKLHPLTEYLDAAEILCARHGIAKVIVLSTDNERVIEELESSQAARRGFTFYYTRFGRINDWGSPIQTAHKTGMVSFVVNSFANLILGAHPCNVAFVQTTSSNWNRLIDELRKTDGVRASAPSIDLEYGQV